MPFWRRSKKDAFDAWRTATTTEVVTTGQSSSATGDPPSSVTSVVVNSETFDPSNPQHRAAIDAAEAMSGMDLDGDGTVAERPANELGFGALFGTPPTADPISRLERLQKLRESGALTDAEFEQQKRRILGSD